MREFSVSVDELRHTASKLGKVASAEPGAASHIDISLPEHPDLRQALVEFSGCMDDCTAERRRAVDAVATGLREVADMFEKMDADAQLDLNALGAVEGWVVE